MSQRAAHLHICKCLLFQPKDDNGLFTLIYVGLRDKLYDQQFLS